MLSAFARNGSKGATVIDSMGMARILSTKHDDDEFFFLNSLRKFLNPEREKSNLIFTAIHEDQVSTAVETIEQIVGDLSSKDTGVVFTVPIDFAKGIM